MRPLTILANAARKLDMLDLPVSSLAPLHPHAFSRLSRHVTVKRKAYVLKCDDARQMLLF